MMEMRRRKKIRSNCSVREVYEMNPLLLTNLNESPEVSQSIFASQYEFMYIHSIINL